MEKDRKQMILVGLLTLVLAGAGWWFSAGWSADASRFPRLALSLLALLGLLLMVQAARGKLVGEYMIHAKQLVGPAISFAIILGYVLLLEVIGFYVATALFLAGYMFYLGQRSWKVMLGATAGVLAFIYLLFTQALGTPLPHGLLY